MTSMPVSNNFFCFYYNIYRHKIKNFYAEKGNFSNSPGNKIRAPERSSGALRHYCRKRDLNPHERNAHTDLNRARLPIPPFLHACGRWDLNPHVYTDTRSLVLPVCQFQHSRIYVPQVVYYHLSPGKSIPLLKKIDFFFKTWQTG